MSYSSAGRPEIGRKYEVRLPEHVARAVADYAETRFPGNRHGAGMARRELITAAISEYQRENRIMAIVNVVVLNQPAPTGMEWGLATPYVPAVETDEVEAFIQEEDGWDNAGTDNYVLVIPDELWDTELNQHATMEVEVPQIQADALTAAITAELEERQQYHRPVGGPDVDDDE